MKTKWSTKKLSEACDILIGGTPSRGISNYWKDGIFPWVSIADMTREGKYITNTKEKITEKGVKNSNVKLIPKDSLLFSFKLSIGKLAFAGEDLYTNEAIAGFIIKDKNELDKNFLYYFLKSSTFDTAQRAVKGNTLNKEKMKVLEIPIPSIEIQKKIVKILDDKFYKLNKAKKIREDNILNAEKILSKTLNEIFKEGKIKGWEEKKIKDIVLKNENIDPKKYFDSSFFYIDITSVSSITNSTLRARLLNKNKAPSRAKKLVFEGDTIFATTRPYLKNIAYISKELSGSVASTGFCVLRPNKLIIDKNFLFNLINSDYFVQKIIPFQKGAAYPAVSDNIIYDQVIYFPQSLTEQKKISQKLDLIFEKIKKLKELQNSQLEDFDKLEKAYLKEAFGGKLI